jgi:hypothetical protein
MSAWLRSWKGGVAVAVTCLAAGLMRAVTGSGDGDVWLTPALFVLAVAYGSAAVIDLHARGVGRSRAVTDRLVPARSSLWVLRRPGPPAYATGGGVAVLTKDRVGAVLAISAAVVGLVLVFDGRHAGASAGDDDPAPPTSQSVPVPGGG